MKRREIIERAILSGCLVATLACIVYTAHLRERLADAERAVTLTPGAQRVVESTCKAVRLFRRVPAASWNLDRCADELIGRGGYNMLEDGGLEYFRPYRRGRPSTVTHRNL